VQAIPTGLQDIAHCCTPLQTRPEQQVLSQSAPTAPQQDAPPLTHWCRGAQHATPPHIGQPPSPLSNAASGAASIAMASSPPALASESIDEAPSLEGPVVESLPDASSGGVPAAESSDPFRGPPEPVLAS
jgi:hypothetical protein